VSFEVAFFVPEGHSTIAQRFIAGLLPKRNDRRPGGTLEPNEGFQFDRPYGTYEILTVLIPSDKSLGYCRVSLRDKVVQGRGLGPEAPVV
jgi:hypothetical protein